MAEIKYSDKSSKEDNAIYKVRYSYEPVRKSADSRDFCKKMESLTSGKVVFRKEDINMMSFRGVNNVLGHNKQNYSLLKFKGGKNCHHYWSLQVYKKSSGKKVNSDEAYSKGLKEPKNPSEMEESMVSRADKGAYPSVLSRMRKTLGI